MEKAVCHGGRLHLAVGSGPSTQTLLSLLHLPCLPQRIKLDIQGGKREGKGERRREGGQEREGERDEKKGSGRNIFPMSG